MSAATNTASQTRRCSNLARPSAVMPRLPFTPETPNRPGQLFLASGDPNVELGALLALPGTCGLKRQLDHDVGLASGKRSRRVSLARAVRRLASSPPPEAPLAPTLSDEAQVEGDDCLAARTRWTPVPQRIGSALAHPWWQFDRRARPCTSEADGYRPSPSSSCGPFFVLEYRRS